MIPLPSLNDIKELIKNGLTLEAQEKIMELRVAALELQDENLELRKQNKELNERLKIKEELVFRDQYYWRPNDENPFCARCWEKDNVLIHVTPYPDYGSGPYRQCPECENAVSY